MKKKLVIYTLCGHNLINNILMYYWHTELNIKGLNKKLKILKKQFKSLIFLKFIKELNDKLEL